MAWLSRDDRGASWFPIYADDTTSEYSHAWQFNGWKFAGVDLSGFQNWRSWSVRNCTFWHCTLTAEQYQTWSTEVSPNKFVDCYING